MRLATYRLQDGTVRHGRIAGDGRVTDLGPGDLSAVVGTLGALPSPEGSHPLDEVTLLAPLARPGKVLAVAANYQEHVTETGGDRIDKSRISPRLFLKPSTAVSGPGEEIALPAVSPSVDWEAELVAVIGRGGKDIPLEDALDHVGGYTIGNDVSARAMDYGHERDTDDPAVAFFDWLNGKWPDGFAALGPYLVTADEVPDPQKLDVVMEVNGRVRQHGDTSQMIFNVAELVAFASRLMTLEPGDVLYTGTPAGVGLATGEFLSAGDEMTVRVTGLGSLVNRVR
ncbi:fumarylacetoacetate hydrolase family protein [Actinomadura viridis]|uniref:2-keto-4-pentenoate hydratase/2-oxohepta-3-ene-1,7-dioic acid hydratase in catechol pathway n=1 Tax=Actinomadura viridis TaxID=58110 RepID=A0A931DH20_9ACTN|nr:fumarylacetoacetate hydrolase family protein [Actinomadura viridis]MBG6088644.1 2-keto-4-pentenoate hydratase/2-oxohepta-3-ene-1,7-dioic acid hydratase in catechol pathway [Actinomadura viridis]